MAICLIGAAATIASWAQVFTTLVTFNDLTDGDGAGPFYGPLVQGTDGNFYGTTTGAGLHGHGTVFKMMPDGALTTLYNFCAQTNCSDGANPYAGLILGADGNLYGVTIRGGADCRSCSGYGTVFKITSGGSLTTLHRFSLRDGADPNAPLVQGVDGNFYGTTTDGGTYSSGTVFKITPAGNLTTLHVFDSVDGASPLAGALVQGADGNFYGTAYNGGANGYGTIFQITPSGVLTTLYSFCSESGCADGSSPGGGLALGNDGNFYGTTEFNGTTGYGTVFKVTPGGMLTTLHTFDSTDGAYPFATLNSHR